MKLVELLVNRYEKWPKGVEVFGADSDGEIRAYGSVEELCQFDFYPEQQVEEVEKSPGFGRCACPVLVDLAQWQAERNRQKGGEWKRHRGGKQPVADGVMVDLKFNNGTQRTREFPEDWEWRKHDADPRITQYRVISQPQAEEIEVKDTTIGTLSYKVEIDTSAANQAIDELSAKWDQIETPFKWRDEVTELNAYIEKFTRERESLINRLALEGFALIPAITPVMGVADVDMSDWRNWKDGDIVEVVFENDADLPIGKQCVVATIEKPDYIYGMPVSVYDDDASDGSYFWPEDITEEGSLVFKFIRRP